MIIELVGAVSYHIYCSQKHLLEFPLFVQAITLLPDNQDSTCVTRSEVSNILIVNIIFVLHYLLYVLMHFLLD